MTEMEAIQKAYIPPGKREMRMHTLNAQMQEQSGNYGPRESDTIYVGNLFYDVEAEDLRTRMEEFGTVVRAFVVHDNRGLSKGSVLLYRIGLHFGSMLCEVVRPGPFACCNARKILLKKVKLTHYVTQLRLRSI